MADTKISGFTAATDLATDDEVPMVDKSDTTDAVTGTNKRATIELLDSRYAPLTLFPENYGAVGDGTTNDTAAFQAMLDDVPTQGGAIIQLSAKTYVLDSAPRTDRGGNCVLSLRYGALDRRPVWIKGAGLGLGGAYGNNNRSILKTTLTTPTFSTVNGAPSLIGGQTPEGGTSGAATNFPSNYCGPVFIQDVSFQFPNDPALAAIDGISFGGLRTERVAITNADTGTTKSTKPRAFGVRMPWTNDFGFDELKDTQIAGFYCGGTVVGAGAKTLTNFYPYKCIIALGFEEDSSDAYRHALRPSTMLAEYCQYLVSGYSIAAATNGFQSISNGHPFIQDLIIDTEQAGSPEALVNLVLDANNKIIGRIEHHRNLGFSYISNQPVSGASNVQLVTTGGKRYSHGTFFTTSVRGAEGGTATQTAAANTMYVAPVDITGSAVLTGIRYRTGGTQLGNCIAALYDEEGTRVAVSGSVAQAAIASANTLAFTSTVRVEPGRHWIGLLFSAAGSLIGTGPNSYLGPSALYAQGSFTTPSSITPPANDAAGITISPIASTY